MQLIEPEVFELHARHQRMSIAPPGALMKLHIGVGDGAQAALPIGLRTGELHPALKRPVPNAVRRLSHQDAAAAVDAQPVRQVIGRLHIHPIMPDLQALRARMLTELIAQVRALVDVAHQRRKLSIPIAVKERHHEVRVHDVVRPRLGGEIEQGEAASLESDLPLRRPLRSAAIDRHRAAEIGGHTVGQQAARRGEPLIHQREVRPARIGVERFKEQPARQPLRRRSGSGRSSRRGITGCGVVHDSRSLARLRRRLDNDARHARNLLQRPNDLLQPKPAEVPGPQRQHAVTRLDRRIHRAKFLIEQRAGIAFQVAVVRRRCGRRDAQHQRRRAHHAYPSSASAHIPPHVHISSTLPSSTGALKKGNPGPQRPRRLPGCIHSPHAPPRSAAPSRGTRCRG